MEKDPIRNDARKARRQRKRGRSGPCLFCGRETPEGFRAVGYSVIDEHHIVGEANDKELTVFLCHGCHDRQTEVMLDHGIELRHLEYRPPAEVLIDIFGSLGLFCQQLGARLLAHTEQQRAFIRQLDENCPGWRDLMKP